MNKSGPGEFQILLLNSKSAWDKGLPVHINVTREGLKIQETRDYVKETAIAGEVFPDRFEIKDFSAGSCHLVYILDSKGLVWIYDVREKRAEPLDCICSLFSRPESIAYSPGTVYIADSTQKKVFALAEINSQIRWTAGPELQSAEENLARNFIPITIRADKDGNIYILTPYETHNSGNVEAEGVLSVPAGGRVAIVKFNKSGRFVNEFIIKIELSTPIKVEQLNEAVDFCIAQDGSLFILETDGRKVIKYLASGIKDWEKNHWTTFPELPSGIGIDGSGNIYIGERHNLFQGKENGCFIYKLSRLGDFLGMVPFFQGDVGKLQIDKDERIYVYSKSSHELTILKQEPVLYRFLENPLPYGIYFSRAFEVNIPEIQWHKLVIDADIPENTQVKVSYLSANEKEFIINGNRINVDELLVCPVNSSEKDFEYRASMLNRLGWSSPLINPKDALIQSQTGRYLWLRIELTGTKEKSPILKSIKVYSPRLSYLRYLPAVYQEDERSRELLERFLSLFETFFSQMEMQIGTVERYFDADFVRGDFLRWLGTWLAIAEDENWPEDKLRLLIKKAPRLYKRRGTREGIEGMIKIYTGDKPFIVEQFQLKCAQAGEEIDPLLVRLFSADPYSFSVLLKPFQVSKENETQALRRIIDSEKPAYTSAKVVSLQPWIYLDMHTYLEVNTYLSKPSLRLDVGSMMPQDTVLTDIDEVGQIERRSKLGWNTSLT